MSALADSRAATAVTVRRWALANGEEMPELHETDDLSKAWWSDRHGNRFQREYHGDVAPDDSAPGINAHEDCRPITQKERDDWAALSAMCEAQK